MYFYKANIDGITATRYEDEGDEIDLIVSLAEEDKTELTDLDSIFVTNGNGKRIPLSSFAHYEEDTAPVSVMRQDQARMTQITLTPAKGYSLQDIQNKVNTLIAENIPQEDNVTISISGDSEDFAEALVNFAVVILMAAALVFAVMASQFESFKDPFIVIFTLPLGDRYFFATSSMITSSMMTTRNTLTLDNMKLISINMIFVNDCSR